LAIPDAIFYQSPSCVSRHPLDPDKPLLFFLAAEDKTTINNLQLWFPQGVGQEVQSYQPENRYYLFRVPALGQAQLTAFTNAHASTQTCP
jgi:hypothetical protein